MRHTTGNNNSPPLIFCCCCCPRRSQTVARSLVAFLAAAHTESQAHTPLARNDGVPALHGCPRTRSHTPALRLRLYTASVWALLRSWCASLLSVDNTTAHRQHRVMVWSVGRLFIIFARLLPGKEPEELGRTKIHAHTLLAMIIVVPRDNNCL